MSSIGKDVFELDAHKQTDQFPFYAGSRQGFQANVFHQGRFGQSFCGNSFRLLEPCRQTSGAESSLRAKSYENGKVVFEKVLTGTK